MNAPCLIHVGQAILLARVPAYPSILSGMHQHGRPAVAVLPDTVDIPTTDDLSVEDHGWDVVVWNDPVNLMEYVV